MRRSEQVYRRLNTAVLVLLLGGLALPFFGPLVAKISPVYPACPSRTWFNRPCPLCGLTRGVGHAVRGRWSGACESNPLSPAVLVLMLGEILYRSLALVPRLAVRLSRARRVDAAVHIVLAGLYLVYAAAFLQLSCSCERERAEVRMRSPLAHARSYGGGDIRLRGLQFAGQ